MKGIAFFGEPSFTIKEDTYLIKENITRILMTVPGERVNNPSFGCELKNYIFDLDFIMQEEVDGEINRSISRWEPRVNILGVQTKRVDENILEIKVGCQIKDTLEEFIYEKLIMY